MERYRSGRNGVDSKSICPVNSRARGFESHPLRQILQCKIQRDLANLFYKMADPPFLTPRSGYSVFVKNPRPRVGILYFFQIAERCPSWLKERDWKSRVLLTVVPRVRIPLSPPNFAMQNLARSRQFVFQIGGSAIFNATFLMSGFYYSCEKLLYGGQLLSC